MFDTHLPHFRARILIMLAGILLMGFFLSVLVEIDLGADPYSSCFLGVARVSGISYGTVLAAANCILFIPMLVRGRRHISFGTLANMFGVGYVCDFFRFVWARLLPSGFFLTPWIRWGLALPAVLGMVTAAACYMASGTGLSPYDALPYLIVEARPRWPFLAVRMTLDLLCVAGALLTGATVGPVTAVMAFCIAPIITAVRRFLEARLK